MQIFEGLSGFPITPLKNGRVDFEVLKQIRDHLDQSGLDSIGVLGSTGSFAYLSEPERALVMEAWSGIQTPWIAGVSATTTAEAIRHSKMAHRNGASGVIANAFSYVPLSVDELERYFLELAESSPLPLCIYDNPVNTGQSLSIDLLARLSAHANVHAIKAFAQADNHEQHEQLSQLRWKAGYAVDFNACEAMINGGSAWYSTLAGTLPEALVPIMRAIRSGDLAAARALDAQLHPVYEAMKSHSGFRVVHQIACQRGWTCQLPPPIQTPQKLNIDLSHWLV